MPEVAGNDLQVFNAPVARIILHPLDDFRSVRHR
jgi:hypothetical protein